MLQLGKGFYKMKKIYIIIVVALFSLQTFAQQNLTSEVAHITLSNDMKKMSKEQTFDLMRNKYKRTKLFRDYNNIYN